MVDTFVETGKVQVIRVVQGRHGIRVPKHKYGGAARRYERALGPMPIVTQPPRSQSPGAQPSELK